jgi:tudor domain-containing protein 3
VQAGDKGFKSLQPSKPKESENDDSEFKAQRKDAIAEATKAGTKKTFGGGSKMLVDSNVQKVMDKGFTEEQATTALKYSRNNVEKALSNLKRRDEHQKRATSNDYEPREYSKEKRGGKGSSAEPTTAKPSGAVSLFDFLENKFPTSQESSAAQHVGSFQNNMSASFRKPADKDFVDKPWAEQKSSQNVRSAGGYEKRDYRDQPRDYRSERNDRNFDNRRDDNRRDFKDTREFKDSRDSRNTRDDPRGYRDNPRDNRDNNRDSKYPQSSSNNNNSSYPSKSITTASNQYQKPSNGSYNNNNGSSTGGDKGKYQKPEYKPNSFAGGNNRDGRDSRDNNRDSRDNNRDSRDTRDNNRDTRDNNRDSRDNNFKPRTAPSSSKYYNDHQSNDYQKSTRNVTESMDKMSLKGNNHHQQQNYKTADTKLNATNYPPLTPATTEPPPQKQPKTYPAKPGYPIVGFQNKEANEHAKSVLKTKNVPAQQQQQQQKPQQQPTKPPANWQQSQAPTKHVGKNQPPPPFSNPPGVAQSAAAPMHSLPQPFAHPGIIQAMPAVIPVNPPQAVFHQTVNYPAPLLMQSVAPPPGMGPQPVMTHAQMKVGDLCLAKYWEDGTVRHFSKTIKQLF